MILLRSLQLAALVPVVALGLGACDASETAPSHPPDSLTFPLSVTADPQRGLVWVVSGNYDLRWRGGAVLALDVRTQAFRPELAFEVGSFPGPFVLFTPPGATNPVAGYIASRTDDALTHVRFREGEDGTLTVECPGGTRSSDDEILRCPVAENARSAPSPDPDSAPLSIGDDPFELAILPSRSPAQPALLLSAALLSGTLASWELAADGTPSLVGSLTLAPTLFALAPDPTRSRAFATWRSLATVQSLTVENRSLPPLSDLLNPWLTPGPSLHVSEFLATLASSSDRSRAAVMSPDGARLYVSWRAPDSLAVLDVRPQTSSILREIRKIGVAGDPGALAVLPATDRRPELVAVACFDAARIEFIDPDAGAVVATVRVPRGPTGLAVMDLPESKRLYVSSFHGDSVSAVDLDPVSETYLTVVATAGGKP